jgi:RNA polymerase sigma factor (sigma-70 family)
MNRLLLQLHRHARELHQPDDRQLLAAFASRRDAEAFALLVRRHGPMVYCVCRRWLREPADIDDAFQATFLVLVRRAASISRPQKLANWLHGVALRTARNLRSRELRRQLRFEPNVDWTSIADTPAVADDEIGPLLDEEISRLPEIYRLPIVLCHLQGLSRRQAATMLACREGTLSARLSRGLALLRQRLVHRGLTAAAAAGLLLPGQTEAVPPLLVRSATRIALESLIAAAPPRVAALAQGVLDMFFIRRLAAGLGVAVLLLGLVAGAGLLLRNSAGTAAHAQAPTAANAAEPILLRVSTDDRGALRQATVSEGGDDVTVTTPRAVGRYLKRVRRDLAANPELTVLLEKTVRTDVLEAIRKACTDAGFTRLQVKSANGQPFELVEAESILDDQRSTAALTMALKFLSARQQSNDSHANSSTALALLALAQSQTDPRQPLQGAWSVREITGGNMALHFNKDKHPFEWIVVGNYLVTRRDDKYAVGRIRVENKNDTQIIEFSYDADTPQHMMHRGTYTLKENRLVITVPGSPTWWHGSSPPETLVLERLQSEAKKR